MEIKFVDLHRQYESIKPEIDEAIAACLARTDFILGSDVARFEEEFAEYCQARYAVGVDNGAAALELALRALGIGPGDEVLVPANSFIASASAVSLAGGTPVFVDVSPVTYTIDPHRIEEAITERTKAIMPVHLYGQPADMDPIMEIARRRDLYVIEDACQAHGARYKGRRVGAIGHVGAFSFYPGKNLGAYGDGGAVVTNDEDLAGEVRVLRNCGQTEKYHHAVVAGNHRLDTMQAAILRAKLGHLDKWNRLRRQWAEMYNDLISGAADTPVEAAWAEHVYHLYVVQVDERSTLQALLASKGISTGVHYPIPIHLQPAYASLGHRPGDFPVTEHAAARALSLPMFAELRPEEIQCVADDIWSFLMGRVVQV